nr:unnamed protein product [Digitaria exilis]
MGLLNLLAAARTAHPSRGGGIALQQQHALLWRGPIQQRSAARCRRGEAEARGTEPAEARASRIREFGASLPVDCRKRRAVGDGGAQDAGSPPQRRAGRETRGGFGSGRGGDRFVR